MPPQSCLLHLPHLNLFEYLTQKPRFELPERQGREYRDLFQPLPGNPRTAVFSRGYLQRKGVRRFRRFDDPSLRRFKPEAVAARVDTLRALAWGVDRGTIQLAPLRHSVIAFTGILEGPLSEEDRDLFWRVFEVPVFEQFRGFDRELLAWECEAHQGLHISQENAIFELDPHQRLLVTSLANRTQTAFRLDTGLDAVLATSTCPCGAEALRLLNLSRRPLLVEAPARTPVVVGAA